MVDLKSYINKLISDICNCQNIIDAIDSTNYTIGENTSLIDNHIFPFHRIPDTQTETSTYILVDADKTNINRENKSFVDITVTIWVMAHQSRMKMDRKSKIKESQTRIMYIAEELENLFDGNENYGHGILELIYNKGIILDEKYQYRELKFICHSMRTSAYNKVGRF